MYMTSEARHFIAVGGYLLQFFTEGTASFGGRKCEKGTQRTEQD